MSDLQLHPGVVLLVDDQAMVGEKMRRLLQGENDLALHYMSSPIEALKSVADLRPTVILLDLVMPGMDGLDAVREFRKIPETSATPIIVLSSTEDPVVKGQAFEAGANDYIVKLPDRIELLARIRYHSAAYVAHVQRDLSMRALHHSQQQLVEANISLLEANRALNEFVGIVSHDLRNPLGAVLGFAKLLLRDNQDPPPTEQQQKALGMIRSSTEFMLRLVDDLLDVSRIESGALHLEKKPTDLAELVRRNVELNKYFAEDKGITLQTHVAADLPTVNVDPDKIEQVLNNLVSNALKFSDSGTTVSISLEPKANAIELSVADQGQGIAAEEIDKLFKPFSRTSAKATKGEKSTGLGLVISKQVVNGHGGEIHVRSEPHQGTTFIVTLPLDHPK